MLNTVGPDAEVVALANRLQELDRQCIEADAHPGQLDDAAFNALLGEWNETADAIVEHEGNSLSCILAKAQAARCVLRMHGGRNSPVEFHAESVLDAILGPVQEAEKCAAS